jgi:anti-sigma-K factor RskA
VFAGVFAAQWVSADREVTQAQRQLDAVAAVLAAPDAKITTATVGGSRATVVVSHSQGKVAFVARSMPQLPADRSYQAWLIGPSGPRSVGVLAAGTDPTPLVGDLASDQRRIGVTIEPRGGSSQPSGDLVMQLELP